MKRWIAVALLFILAGCAKQDWVAKVGDTIIYKEAVEERIARGMTREKAIEEIVDETLMYKDALKKGYAELAQDEIEKSLDAIIVRRLYKEVVLDKIRVNAYEVKKHWNMLNKEVRTRKISVRDRGKAEAIYRKLIIGESFQELARGESEDRATASKGGDLGWLNYKSQIEPELIERIFGLGKEKFSRPFQSGPNWVILMVEDIRFKEESLTIEETERIRQELIRQKGRELATSYPEHLELLADIIFDDGVLEATTKSIGASGLPDTSLLDPDRIILTSLVEDITVGDLVQISENRRRPPFNDPENIKIFLTNYLIYEVILPLEARRLKIHKYPDIEKDTERKAMGVILRHYSLGEIEDKIPEPTDSEIGSYYENNLEKFKDVARAKVKIIETKTEKEAKEARERIIDGEDFAKLAREVSTHASNTRGGTLGWVRKEQYRELDKKIFTVPLNTVTNPFRISTGWCIILAEDRKEERIRTLDEVKRPVAIDLRAKGREEIKKEILERLREIYPVKFKEVETAVPTS